MTPERLTDAHLDFISGELVRSDRPPELGAMLTWVIELLAEVRADREELAVLEKQTAEYAERIPVLEGRLANAKGTTQILGAVAQKLEETEGRLAEAEKHIAFVEHEWGLDEERLIETRGRLAEVTDTLRERDAEVKNLTKALRFYADEMNWRSDRSDNALDMPATRDNGKIARKALRAERAPEGASSELRSEPTTATPSFNDTLCPTDEPTPSFDGTLAPDFGEEPAKDAADYTWSEAKFTPIDLPDPLD